MYHIFNNYNKASFISINHSHLLFRGEKNVQNTLLRRVEDIGKQYLLILYIIAKYSIIYGTPGTLLTSIIWL